VAQCRFNRRDGSPCRGVAVGSHGGCFAHDDDFQLERKRNTAAQRKGGKKGGRGRPTNPGTADLQRLQKAFEELAYKVLRGEVDRATAAVITQCWNGARSCISASGRLRELEEVEARLDAIETDLGPERGSREA
jgi:hypothetical protein